MLLVKNTIISFSLLISSHLSIASTALSRPVACLSTREYITTLEYLRDHKDFSLTESQAREIADKVSTGCSNASKRFVNVTEILSKAGLPSNKAISTGIKFANKDDDAAEAFLTVFKGSFNEQLLDLDMGMALQTALELADTFKGNRKSAVKDFNLLIDFCLSKKNLDLPLTKCASISTRVIKSGEEFDYKVGESFIDLFNYLSKPNKPNLPTYQALEVSEQVVKYGPEAKGNFMRSYEYAVDKKGLDLTVKEAIDFGKLMASRSVKNLKTE